MATTHFPFLIFFALASLASSLNPLLSTREISSTTDHPSLEDMQIAKPCKVRFDKISFSSITSICKGPEYEEKACCASFQKLACKYGQHVNDYSTSCPVEFMAYLNYAGNFPHGVFIDRCISSHLLCSK